MTNYMRIFATLSGFHRTDKGNVYAVFKTKDLFDDIWVKIEAGTEPNYKIGSEYLIKQFPCFYNGKSFNAFNIDMEVER